MEFLFFLSLEFNILLNILIPAAKQKVPSVIIYGHSVIIVC